MDNQIKIWSLVTYECIIAFKCHSDSILCLELTLDGNLMSCSFDEKVKLWQIETGEELKSIEFDYYVCCIKILNDELVAFGLRNGQIKIYNFIKDETIKNFIRISLIFCF